MQQHRTRLVEKRRTDLLELASGLELLPSTCAVPMRILQLHRSSTASMNEFADVISVDAGLSAKILAIVNSSAFGTSGRITRLSHALPRIGIKNLLPLVFGISLGGIFNKLALPSDERATLWRSSLLKGIAARELAQTLAPEMAEEAFLCGLLQDVALPVIYAADRSAWPETVALLQIDADDERLEREQLLYGIGHAELGGHVAAGMGLPELFQHAIHKHHDATATIDGESQGLIRAVQGAAAVPHRIIQVNARTLQGLATAVRTAMSEQPPAEHAKTLRRIISSYGEMLASFGGGDESNVGFKTFLQSLCEEIVQAMESAVSESTTVITNLKARETELLDKVDQLQHDAAQSDYDSLTGLLNRRGFYPRAKRLLSLAREYAWPCAIGFIDLNDLKHLNDSYGHASGDAALVSCASRLAESMNGYGIAARMGGDEFAVMILDRDLSAVQADVERIRQCLTDFVIDVGAEKVATGASVGILVIELPSPAHDIDSLLKRADETMYQSKRSRKRSAGPAHTAHQSAA
jgi:diguanylate cyclase (GGDEF)-like protein